jgi:protein SCO1/2
VSRRPAALVAALALGGCGGSGAATAPGTGPGTGTGTGLQGLVLRPAKAAPALALRNYTGAPVRLSSLRGRAVFVTFVYTHCPDVCPLIVASLASAQRQLARRASEVRILAVTVDPRRDTPTAIRAFLSARDAIGRMDYLIGSPAQLTRVWKRWDVAVTEGAKRVTAGHSSVIYGITGTGRMAVVYPSNVTPAQIEHDALLLARS